MNDLENISYSKVVNTDSVCYSEWRKGLKPIYTMVWRDILSGYFAIILLIILNIISTYYFPSLIIPAAFITSVMIGFVLAYLALFIHEAGHFNLHPVKKRSDLLATFFLCSLFGIDIKSYRKIHWEHHLHLGTTSDTENSYFNALTSSFLLESLTGIYMLKVIANKNANSILTPEMKKASFKMIIAGGLINALIIVLFIKFHQLPMAFAWIGAMLIFFPFFATLRQVLEHRSDLALKKINYKHIDQGKVSRLFNSRFLSRIFGGAGFNKHMIHHWDPQISYTRLKDVETFLSTCDATQGIIKSSRTGYFKTFRKLLFR